MRSLLVWPLSADLSLECETMGSLLRLRVLQQMEQGTRVHFSMELPLGRLSRWDISASEPIYLLPKTVRASTHPGGNSLEKPLEEVGPSPHGLE
jgi:hypothetical protein